MKLDAPFDLTLDRSGTALALDGRVGLAEIETVNFAAHQLTSSVMLRDRQLAFDQIEVSEQVARPQSAAPIPALCRGLSFSNLTFSATTLSTTAFAV